MAAPRPGKGVPALYLTWAVMSSSARSCSSWSHRCCRAGGRAGYTNKECGWQTRGVSNVSA